MRQYINVNGVIIPKPLSWQPAPLLLPAFDQPDYMSIQAQSSNHIPLSDDSCFVEDNMHRWRDRDFKDPNWRK